MKEKNNNTWQRNAINIVLFVLLVIVADFVVGSILGHFYKKQTSGWDYGTRYSAEETKADVLLFGASRAQQQYNPNYFEDTLHLSCYNVGRDGVPFPYHYAILQSVLKRYSPKVVVLDLEYKGLKEKDNFDRLSPLLPLYNDHPEMRNTIALKSKFEKIKLLSRSYAYNSMLFRILIGNTKKGMAKNKEIKGYIPLERSLKELPKTWDYTEQYPIDSVRLGLLNSFIDDCKAKGVKLFLVCPPYYYHIIGKDYSIETAKKIATEKNIPFIDYSQDSFFLKSPHLFDDTVHVNKTGSAILSSRIAAEIKANLTN